MDLPLAFFPIDGEEEESGGWRMVDGSIQQQKVRAKLADGKSLALEDQVHFHFGGVPGVTGGCKDGRRHR